MLRILKEGGWVNKGFWLAKSHYRVKMILIICILISELLYCGYRYQCFFNLQINLIFFQYSANQSQVEAWTLIRGGITNNKMLIIQILQLKAPKVDIKIKRPGSLVSNTKVRSSVSFISIILWISLTGAQVWIEDGWLTSHDFQIKSY